MPELPEVEVVRSTLEPVLKNLKIKSIQALYPPIIEQPLEEFKRKVENKKILRIDRYAKYLILFWRMEPFFLICVWKENISM